jgi:hypothetical protein
MGFARRRLPRMEKHVQFILMVSWDMCVLYPALLTHVIETPPQPALERLFYGKDILLVTIYRISPSSSTIIEDVFCHC